MHAWIITHTCGNRGELKEMVKRFKQKGEMGAEVKVMYEWEFRRGWKEERVIIVSISCETKRRIKRGIERIMEENGILFQRDLAGLRVKYSKG